MEKITKRMKFEMLKEIEGVASNEMLMTFIENEINLLDKKNGSSKKPTKEQLENLELKDKVLAYMVENKDHAFTATEIYKNLDLKSNQKATAILKMLKTENVITRFEEKGVAYFKAI